MACSINLFSYLGGTPDTDGTWTLFSGGPVDLAVNGAASATFSDGNALGTDNNTTIDVSTSAAGTYVFRYSVAGGGSCEAAADVTVTVEDGVVAGVSQSIPKCSDDVVAYNIFDFFKGGNGLGTGVIAVTESGTIGGTGTSTAGAGYSAGTSSPTDDTFTPSLAPVGAHVFTYTVDNGDGTTPAGCTNCEWSGTLTITVYELPNAGTAGNVTLCNAA